MRVATKVVGEVKGGFRDVAAQIRQSASHPTMVGVVEINRPSKRWIGSYVSAFGRGCVPRLGTGLLTKREYVALTCSPLALCSGHRCRSTEVLTDR